MTTKTAGPTGLAYFADLPSDALIVRLEQVPNAEPSAEVTVRFEAPDGAAQLFVWDGDLWEPHPAESRQDPDETSVFAVKAGRFAGPDWDGKIRLTATVTGDEPRSITTTLRAAPFVMASSTQHAETVFVRAYPGRNDAMIDSLRRIAAEADFELHVIPGDAPYPPNHIWLQDAVEFGHAWTGEPDAIRVAMPSNRNRDLDRFAEPRLLGPGVGVIKVGDYRHDYASGSGGVSWIDWYGNLEATPPTPGHPFGRIIYGYDPATEAQLNPEVVAFLDAQRSQPTLALDVGWLLIKHVDEMVSFMPADDDAWPYRLVVPDTTVALAVLEEVVAAGHWDTPMLANFEEGTTAATILADTDFVEHNRTLQAERIEPNVALICERFGIDPDHVVRLPALFDKHGSARMPNVVNALIVNGHVIMADPDGPDLPDGDPFQARVRALLADLPVTVHFVDDRLYHKWSGNVHCATNAMRRPLQVDTK